MCWDRSEIPEQNFDYNIRGTVILTKEKAPLDQAGL